VPEPDWPLKTCITYNPHGIEAPSVHCWLSYGSAWTRRGPRGRRVAVAANANLITSYVAPVTNPLRARGAAIYEYWAGVAKKPRGKIQFGYEDSSRSLARRYRQVVGVPFPRATRPGNESLDGIFLISLDFHGDRCQVTSRVGGTTTVAVSKHAVVDLASPRTTGVTRYRKRLCWRNPGCSSCGQLSASQVTQKQRRPDHDISHKCLAASIRPPH